MKDHSQGFLKIVHDAKSRVKETSVQEVNSWLKSGEDITLIDVREESEWAAGHLPKAVHLSKGIIERDIEKKIPEKDERIVLYCGGGFRSVLTADNLQKMGYTNVISMDGGFSGWNNAGFDIVKD